MAHPSFPAKTDRRRDRATPRSTPGKLDLRHAADRHRRLSRRPNCSRRRPASTCTIVPYNGTAQLTNDLIGGHVPLGFNVMAPAMGNLQAGTLRAMAVLGPKRIEPSARRADRDRIRPAGLRGDAALRPAGAGRHAEADHRPPQQGAARARHLARRCASASQADGGDPLPSTPEEYAADIDAGREAKWSALIRKLEI